MLRTSSGPAANRKGVAASRDKGDLISFLSSSLPASEEVSSLMKL